MAEKSRIITIGEEMYGNKLAIIILTKNKVDMLFRCIYSIVYHNTYNKNLVTIYICDTGSTKKNKERMKKQFARIQREHGYRIVLIEEKEYHFSRNNNMVVRNHVGDDADLLLFMNNDVELINDAIRMVVDRWDDTIGTVGARLMFPDDTIQHVGMSVDENRLRISHVVYRRVWDSEREEVNSYGNTGAFMLTSLERFREIGGFNEEYEDVFQDAEFNLECIRMGYRNVCVTKAVCWHDESSSRKGVEKRLPKEDVRRIVTYLAGFVSFINGRKRQLEEKKQEG